MTIGFDIGGSNCKAAVTRPVVGNRGGGNMIDVVLDEASKRTVPPYVGFPDAERSFGLNAKKAFKSNINTTIKQPTRLLGCSMEGVSPKYQSSVEIVANPCLTTGGVQTPCYQVTYQGETVLIPPEHAQASLLKHQVKHCEQLKVTSKECCITVPNNCSYAKREALLTASEIAGVNCLKLVSASSAVALEYGLLGRKANLDGDSAVVFIDCGHSGINVGCVRYFKGGWDIVLLDTFEDFSGELLETRMIELFNEKFKASKGKEFISSLKSCEKIRALVPKLLKQLVVDEKAAMHVDYLFEDIDFRLELTRDEIWGIVANESAAFEKFLQGFLQLSKEKLSKFESCPFSTVEIVGQMSRMLALKDLLSRVCKEEIGIETLSTTCNTDEAVVKGCVLQCAILSPRFGIRGGQIKDVCPYSVVISRQGLDFDDGKWNTLERSNFDTLFPFLNELNKTKSIKFKKPRPLKLIIAERDMRNNQRLIGIANIDTEGHDTLNEKEEWSKFMVLVTMDVSGLLQLRCEITKQMIELVDVKKTKEVEMSEEEYQEALAKAQEEAKKKAEAEAKKKAEAEAKKKALPIKINLLSDAEKEAAKNAENTDGAAEANEEEVEAADAPADSEMEDVEVPEVKISRMKTIQVTEKQEKKVFRKIEVPVQFTSYMAMSESAKKAILETESKMAAFDAECERVQQARNNLETYVLDAQGHFADGGDFFEYMTPEEGENFMNSLFEMDDWLGDDEFDQKSEVYQGKLDGLRAVGDIYEVRCKEFVKRGAALTMMKKTLNSIESWIMEGSKAEDFAHIEEATFTELSSKVKEASSWLDERQQVSANGPKTQDPPFFANEISDKAREINGAYLAVKAIPKPKPKKEEKKEEEKKEEKKEDATKSDAKDAEEDVKMEDATAKEDAKDVEMENAATDQID